MHLLVIPRPTEHSSSHGGHQSPPTPWMSTVSAPKAQQETCAHTGAHGAVIHKAVISSSGQNAMAPVLTMPPASVGSVQTPHKGVSLSITCPTAYFWKKQGFRISTAGGSAVSLHFFLKRDGQTSTHQQIKGSRLHWCPAPCPLSLTCCRNGLCAPLANGSRNYCTG